MEKEKKRFTDEIIESQKVIDNVNNAISVLQKYIYSQKDELNKTKNNLKKMYDEINEVEPLHKESKKLFESYFNLYSKFYEKKNKKLFWINILSGFIIGVIASITAGIILFYFQRKKRKKSINTDTVKGK